MKRIITTLFIIAFSLNCFSQQFQWAKSYTGIDAESNIKSNFIHKSVFDSQGNIYIVGTATKAAMIDTTYIFPQNLAGNATSVFVAKLNPQGVLLWRKSLKHSNNHHSNAYIQIVGDSSIVLFSPFFSPESNSYEWFLDTLITNTYGNPPQYPVTKGSYNAFFTLDLDGNLISSHFLQHNIIDSNGVLNPYFRQLENSSYGVMPFHVDNNGCTYLFACFVKREGESFNLLVDLQDTIYCGGSLTPYKHFKLFKFSPEFDLLWVKDIIRDTLGIYNNSTFEFRPRGLSSDEDDNMYITGYINHFFHPIEGGYTPDSTRFTILDLGNNVRLNIQAGCGNFGFIIKYDTSGEPQWANQMYIEPQFPSIYPTLIDTEFYSSSINENTNSIFTFARIGSEDCRLFFDSLHNIEYNDNYGMGFIRYDKTTGEYISHGLISAVLGSWAYPSVASINNQVFAEVRYNSSLALEELDTVFTTPNNSAAFAMIRWKDNGELIGATNITSTSSNYSYFTAGKTEVNSNGDLFLTGIFSDNLTLGNITLNGTSSQSNAFMALFQDPAFSQYYNSVRFTETICQGDTFNFRGRDLTTSGIYRDTLQAYNGQDSIIVLDLIVHTPPIPSICMVTVDENSHTNVIWTKRDTVDFYNIYRENTQSGQYDLMATIPFSNPPIWIDTLSNVLMQSYRYRLSTTDYCGESELSHPHKTIHLSINPNLYSDAWNLTWNAYDDGIENNIYDYYNVYRGPSIDSLEFINIASAFSGNTYYYIDYNYPSGINYYQVEVLDSSCLFSGSHITIRSNYATNDTLNSIVHAEQANNNLILFPNPTKDEINIETKGERIYSYTLYNMGGQEILKSEKIKVKNEKINLSNLPKGVYVIKVITDKNVYTRKVIRK